MNSTMKTKGGNYRYKYMMRSAFKGAALVGLVGMFCVYNHYSHGDMMPGRRLAEEESNWKGMFQVKADPMWMLAVYILAILYMFLALAIVCDEYFVPALEEMSGENQLNLSLDIAGATLMAAGGSAPELFTSLIGTFNESSVGFGTIVGSAVFNVLFVIGMCSLLSKETLQLTWWPLFRDSTYYAISLLVLAVFVGVHSAEEIEIWEAAVLLSMYLGYVLVMALNERLYRFFSGGQELYPDEEENSDGTFVSFKHHTTFRAGLLTLIRDPNSWLDKARIGFVSKISGNVDDVFDFVDENNDGELDRDEVKRCFVKLGDTDITEDALDQIMNDLDTNNNGKITKNEFKAWYLHSEEHVKEQIKVVFDTYDSDKSGTITKEEFKKMLLDIDPSVTYAQLDEAADEIFTYVPALPFNDFAEWYLKSTYYHKQKNQAQKDEVGSSLCDALLPPKGATCFGYFKYVFLFPLVASLVLTIPDVRRPGVPGKMCYVAFILSISWIGVYSFFMVGWAETIGATLGIPSYIMGLTFLAAGTSVPDLLSSVIVARMGEGDMAVSSSIGSNIFDILIGLPLPWLVYLIYPNGKDTVTIGADGIWVSIMILLGMLVVIILSIHLSKWRLTKTLGFSMFLLYFAFLLQAIIREYLF